MPTKRITMIHSPDSVDDKKRLKMWPKMDNFWLKNIKVKGWFANEDDACEKDPTDTRRLHSVIVG